MAIDVFISYEHNSKLIADNICSVLENSGARCWYAPRDVMCDYATAIYNAISEAKIMVVVLGGVSSNSPHVLNEMELAYKRIVTGDNIAILPIKIDSDELSKAMHYYINRMHWIDATTAGIEQAINTLKVEVMAILGKPVNAGASVGEPTAKVARMIENITPENLRFGMLLGYNLSFLEWVWDTPYYSREDFEKSKAQVVDVLPFDMNVDSSSFRGLSQSILNYYNLKNASIFTAVLLGITIQRGLLVGSSKNPAHNEELSDLAHSTLAATSSNIIPDKEKVFDFILSNKEHQINDFVDFFTAELTK